MCGPLGTKIINLLISINLINLVASQYQVLSYKNLLIYQKKLRFSLESFFLNDFCRAPFLSVKQCDCE